MIKVTDIHKRFGDLEVLKGVSLDVAEGEVVSIVGASGAGKTTLLQIVGTLSCPDAGRVEIDGQDAFSLGDKTLSRFRNGRIGFVFQFHHLLPEFTAFENVCIPGFIGRRPRAEVERRAAELLEMMNLTPRRGHKPGQLSGGEQQRVAIARALINSPAVLLADEPSGNLDSHNRDEIHRLFFELRDRLGQTVVIVTHDEHLAAMADRKMHRLSDGSPGALPSDIASGIRRLCRVLWTTNSKSCSNGSTTNTTARVYRVRPHLGAAPLCRADREIAGFLAATIAWGNRRRSSRAATA